jgi:hypothetical protein
MDGASRKGNMVLMEEGQPDGVAPLSGYGTHRGFERILGSEGPNSLRRHDIILNGF